MSKISETAAFRGRLGAGRAAGLFVGLIGFQLLAAAAVAVAVSLPLIRVGDASGLSLSSGEITQLIMPPILMGSVTIGGISALALAWGLGRGSLRYAGPGGAAWTLGPRRGCGYSLIWGVGLAAVFACVSTLVFPRPPGAPLGPIAMYMGEPGIWRFLWSCYAVFFAPPVEEMIFRGAIFGGFLRSTNLSAASVIATLLFVVPHVPQAVYYPPALIGITALGVGALAARLRYGAVGPAVALHSGYNLVLVIMANY